MALGLVGWGAMSLATSAGCFFFGELVGDVGDIGLSVANGALDAGQRGNLSTAPLFTMGGMMLGLASAITKIAGIALLFFANLFLGSGAALLTFAACTALGYAVESVTYVGLASALIAIVLKNVLPVRS